MANKGSVTIRHADDGSFIIEGNMPHSDMSPQPSEFVTHTAPTHDEALNKAAKLLRKMKRETPV